MKNKMALLSAVALASFSVCLLSAQTAERGLAEGLTAAGIATAAKGNTTQAKDIFFKALAHDDSCPDALFELAKIIDKEGDASAAGDLFQRAALLYAQEAKPANVSKRNEAEKRAKALNPLAAKLGAAYEDYALDLDKIVKKIPDNLTEVSALERVNELGLPTVLPPDKLPKFYAVAQAAQEKKVAAAARNSDNPPPPPPENGGPRRRRMENPKAEGATAPDVEKELKALGWATVTGTWVKKSTGVYEATDAKLEAQKTNGIIDFWVVKSSGEGTVKAMVRSDPRNGEVGGGPPGMDRETPRENEMTGYGTFFRGKDFRNYGFGERGNRMRRNGPGGPGGGGGGAGISPLVTTPINEALPKHHFTVKVDDVTLDYFYNNASTHHTANAKLSHTGSFVLDVNGTVTLEAPRCSGQ